MKLSRSVGIVDAEIHVCSEGLWSLGKKAPKKGQTL